MFENFESRTGGLAIEMWRAEDELPNKDDGLQERIWARLHELPVFAGRDLAVVVHEGVATLSGTVASQVDRMTAAGCAETVPGITRVENAILVR